MAVVDVENSPIGDADGVYAGEDAEKGRPTPDKCYQGTSYRRHTKTEPVTRSQTQKALTKNRNTLRDCQVLDQRRALR